MDKRSLLTATKREKTILYLFDFAFMFVIKMVRSDKREKTYLKGKLVSKERCVSNRISTRGSGDKPNRITFFFSFSFHYIFTTLCFIRQS